jgi:hypothetical protein
MSQLNVIFVLHSQMISYSKEYSGIKMKCPKLYLTLQLQYSSQIEQVSITVWCAIILLVHIRK